MRPTRFEHNRFLGDKRIMRVHDLDAVLPECELEDLMASEKFLAFGPDCLPEARNRCFRPCPHCISESVSV
jgi:hypothetical protein